MPNYVDDKCCHLRNMIALLLQLAPLDGRKWTETECSIFTDILCRFVGNEAINAKCIDTEPSGVSYVVKIKFFLCFFFIIH